MDDWIIQIHYNIFPALFICIDLSNIGRKVRMYISVLLRVQMVKWREKIWQSEDSWLSWYEDSRFMRRNSWMGLDGRSWWEEWRYGMRNHEVWIIINILSYHPIYSYHKPNLTENDKLKSGLYISTENFCRFQVLELWKMVICLASWCGRGFEEREGRWFEIMAWKGKCWVYLMYIIFSFLLNL